MHTRLAILPLDNEEEKKLFATTASHTYMPTDWNCGSVASGSFVSWLLSSCNLQVCNNYKSTHTSPHDHLGNYTLGSSIKGHIFIKILTKLISPGFDKTHLKLIWRTSASLQFILHYKHMAAATLLYLSFEFKEEMANLWWNKKQVIYKQNCSSWFL